MGRAHQRAVLVRLCVFLNASAAGLAAAPEVDAQQPEAQRGDGGEAGDRLPPTPSGPGSDPVGTETATVVFIAEEQDDPGLRDALLAQFALIDAELRFADPGEPAPDLAAQIDDARALADEHGAIAVFWIVPAEDGRWLLHMMDARGDRLAMRTIEADEEARSAAVEAVAVISRESTRALLAGEMVEAQPLPPPPPPPEPTPVPARTRVPPPRYATRLALGYEGTEFAKSHFQSGLALEVSVRGPEQFYGGVGLTWATTVEVDQPLSFEVSRLPVRALAGYRHRLDPVWLDGELGLGVDILSRETAVEQPGVPPDLATVSPEGDSSRLLYVLSPRARVELPVVPPVGLHAVVGIDVLLNNFSYVSDSGDDFVLLRPRRVRVLVGVGLAFYP